MTPHTFGFLANPTAQADFIRCRPYLEAALEAEAGAYMIEDVADGIAKGDFHFWPGKASAAVTVMHQYPRARFLNVWLAGGDLDEIMDMEPCFVSWAGHLGCARIGLTGRPGWEKALKHRDWRRTAVVLTKSIETGSKT